MENKCRMCGQCCERIHIGAKTCWDLREDNCNIQDAEYVRENWEYLGSSEHIGGFKQKDYYGQDVFYGVYRCKLLTEDKKCSIHEINPRVCSGYPWYENRSHPWPYIGCGYERDSHELDLIKVLGLIRDKKQGEFIETKRKESKDNLLSVCETSGLH